MSRNPVDVLLDDSDPPARARAHVALGREALAEGATDRARRHFREAARLAPDDPEVLSAFRALGEARGPAPARRRWSLLGGRARRR
jgi:Flp pilus assembly protein TadD